MHRCVKCGGVLLRIRRRFWEKPFCLAVLRCPRCGFREIHWGLFFLGIRSHCPRCWNLRLKKLRKVDRIETMYKNPVSYMQKWLGANLYYCKVCRLQFYDLRA